MKIQEGKILGFSNNFLLINLTFQVIPLECFEGTSCTNQLVPIVAGGRSIPLTFHNRLLYVEQAVYFRLHELDLQVMYMYYKC